MAEPMASSLTGTILDCLTLALLAGVALRAEHKLVGAAIGLAACAALMWGFFALGYL
jgi:phosphate/sulfate permease